MSDRIVGLDLSLTATGWCDGDVTHVIGSAHRGPRRLDEISHTILGGLYEDDIVVLEGYSYASHNQAHQLGELGGVVRHALWTHHITYVEVPPKALKKFATDKGNAGKPDMLAAAIRAGYEGPNNDNCVDAWWLRQMGLYATRDAADWDGVHTTAYRDEAVAKIDWPALIGPVGAVEPAGDAQPSLLSLPQTSVRPAENVDTKGRL